MNPAPRHDAQSQTASERQATFYALHPQWSTTPAAADLAGQDAFTQTLLVIEKMQMIQAGVNLTWCL